MQAHDHLEEIDLSVTLDPTLKIEVINMLKEFKDYFAWDFHEMPDLSQKLVELKLPIKLDKKPMNQTPRRFIP